jgi:hypothetical protein
MDQIWTKNGPFSVDEKWTKFEPNLDLIWQKMNQKWQVSDQMPGMFSEERIRPAVKFQFYIKLDHLCIVIVNPRTWRLETIFVVDKCVIIYAKRLASTSSSCVCVLVVLTVPTPIITPHPNNCINTMCIYIYIFVWKPPCTCQRADCTNRFPRTLAGFGLTWHGGSRFSCLTNMNLRV